MKTRGKITGKISGKIPNDAKEKVSKTINQAITQAKGSLKLIQALEQETMARAMNFAKITGGVSPKKITNETIVSTLRKLGFATRDEVQALKDRVEALESELAQARKGKGAAPSGEAVPPL